MDTLALNENWDLYLDDNGNIAVLTGGTALAQDAASAIRTFQGEVYYDTTIGIPYWTVILDKMPPLVLIKSLMVQAAKTVPGVVSAVVYFTGFTGRVFRGQVQISDVTGQIFAANF